ncbi:MAG TPA: hypothetical protein VFA95_11535, partial [Gammaproteobacteria bacterium]|nr:hypothetical protein [Gammaproteobacteria bacterium]
APALIFATNPGGDPEQLSGPDYAIGNRVFAKHHELTVGWKDQHAYTPLQQRLRGLLKDTLGLEDIAAVPYTNLIFQRTSNTSGLDWSLADKCWPVNELILSLVRPRLVITIGNGLGNSPYAYLKHVLEGDAEQSAPSGFGRYRLRYATARHDGYPVSLLGLPHLSRYPVTSPAYGNARAWIQARAMEAGVPPA